MRDKFCKFGFCEIPEQARVTWRFDYLLALNDAKKKGLELPTTFNFSGEFKYNSVEEFLDHLKPLVQAKKDELDKSEFHKHEINSDVFLEREDDVKLGEVGETVEDGKLI